MDSRSDFTLTDDASGVCYGQFYWNAKEGTTSSNLLEKADSLSGQTLINADDMDSGYSDEVYVMNGGVLSNSTVIGGKVEVYSGGTARGITLGNAETVGHIMAYGGTLKNITVKNGGVYLYSDSVVSGLTVAADSSSARIMMPEMLIRATLPIGIWWEPVRSAAERPDCSGRNTQPARSICRKMRKMYPI